MLCSSRLQEPVLAPDSPYVSGLPDSFCLSGRAWVSLLSEQQHETLGTPKRDCGGDPGPRKGCTEGCLHTAQSSAGWQSRPSSDSIIAMQTRLRSWGTRRGIRSGPGTRTIWSMGRPGPEAAAGAQARLADEAGCRGLLPRTRKEPCQDHAQDGLSRQQGVPLRLDRRARKGSCIDNGATVGLCAKAHNDSNALDAIMCRVGAGRQAEGHIGNPLST